MKMTHIAIDKLEEPKHAIRTSMNKKKYDELVESIRNKGVLEPLLVKATPTGFEIICGHRRWLAAAEVGLTKLPCLIFDRKIGDGLEEKYHENTFREGLSDHEEAKLFQYVHDSTDLTVSQISTKYGRTQAYINARLELLTYPDELINAVASEQITLSQAKELNMVSDDTTRSVYLDQAIDQQAPLKKIRVWVGNWLQVNQPELYEQHAERYEKNISPIAKVPCDFCGNDHELTNLRTLRICQICAQKMFANQPKETQEQPAEADCKDKEKK